MNIKVDFDVNAISQKIQNNIAKCQIKLDSQVLKDSNYYCPVAPVNGGTLQKSAILNSKLGSGKLVWQTPYAIEQYYSKPNKSHDKNPNASMKWFEVAKSKNAKNWEKLVNDEYCKNDK